jgi:hypothetical protein
MSWNPDFSVQIFSYEHCMKIVVRLPDFLDDGSEFQELLILEIAKQKLLRYLSYKVVVQENTTTWT